MSHMLDGMVNRQHVERGMASSRALLVMSVVALLLAFPVFVGETVKLLNEEPSNSGPVPPSSSALPSLPEPPKAPSHAVMTRLVTQNDPAPTLHQQTPEQIADENLMQNIFSLKLHTGMVIREDAPVVQLFLTMLNHLRINNDPRIGSIQDAEFLTLAQDISRELIGALEPFVNSGARTDQLNPDKVRLFAGGLLGLYLEFGFHTVPMQERSIDLMVAFAQSSAVLASDILGLPLEAFMTPPEPAGEVSQPRAVPAPGPQAVPAQGR